MGFHHVALATRDTRATHHFYTEAMGFELVKAVVGPTDHPDGWAKHLFYDTGGGLIAFWEIHDDAVGDFEPAIATGLGLPIWSNHLAFHAELDRLDVHRDRWLDHGFDVVEVDHGFCVSIYTVDPNGVLVEWCADTRCLDEQDREHALRTLADPNPPREPMKQPRFHRARTRPEPSGEREGADAATPAPA
jgi:catechol 2,3-dioxygenase-like lactoylglutathione lyase family enzyme